MDLIRNLGELAFGSRLKRLVKRTDSDIAKIYSQLGVDFRPRWFPLLLALSENRRLSITGVANALHYSHTAVNKLAAEMSSHGLLQSAGDPHDGRKRMVRLTKKGRDTVASLRPVWEEIRQVTKELVNSGDHNVLLAVEAIEDELDKSSVYERLRERMESHFLSQIEIIEYASRHKPHFSSLNRQWLERHFELDEQDERILLNPYQEIIKKGGCIVFARLDGGIVGTAALIKHDGHTFELAMMAVAESAHRRFVGTKLILTLIRRAKALGAHSLFLQTPRRLKAAQKLGEKMDFQRVDKSLIPTRCRRPRSIIMKLDLGPKASKTVRKN
jgi:DNA-binding MarR family transcriptional regulator/N-acetylglutamate synthase-like GNAT family acetyltransferase